jgi:YidC/Oxa1 family membrane protein insertase
MPDQVSPTKPGGKKELSMETRLLIAFLLMGIVLFVTPYLYKPAPGPQSKSNVTPQKAEQVTKPPSPGDNVAEAAKPAAPDIAPPGQVKGEKEDTFTVDTKLYRIVFSNKGAVVKSWTLKSYQDLNGKPLELVNQGSIGKTPPPFSIDFKDRKPDVDLNQALWAGKVSADGLGVDFEFSDGKTTARKVFQFGRESYLSRIESTVAAPGAGLPHLLMWRGGFGDSTLQNAASVERTLYYDTADSKLNFKVPKDAKNGPVSVSGPYSFAGLEDTFFTAVALPQGNGNTELRTYSDQIPFGPDKKEEPFVGAGLGGDAVNRFEMFVGPKDSDILKKVNAKLEQAIDWGRWFGWLAKPLFLVLNWVNDRMTHNYGWAIVVVTIGLNMLLLPVRLSGMKSAKKMSALQPQIQAINAKYKGFGLRDPRQSEKNQEIMDLYKKHGVNPISSGCMPMLFQFPFFIAFYTVLTVAIELRGAHWMWVTDLSRPEQLAIRALPVLLIVTQFLQQKLTPPTPGVDPAQQKAMMFMPLALGFMFYYQSAGLVLYWLTGNLVGIAQQWLMNRATHSTGAQPAVVDVKPVSKKR